MSGSFSSTHTELETTPSPTPSESHLLNQSIHRPLKRSYAFYLELNPPRDRSNEGESSVLGNGSTAHTTTAEPPSIPNRRRARAQRKKGGEPTRFSQRIWEIMEKRRKLQLQLEQKETKPAKRRKI
ncbi:hypothetical protein FRC02_001263 [Tulasnella sp. 418]|nr:hypothetical protein FRC02_001263 [Tulasnella sp. 418]